MPLRTFPIRHLLSEMLLQIICDNTEQRNEVNRILTSLGMCYIFAYKNGLVFQCLTEVEFMICKSVEPDCPTISAIDFFEIFK